MEAGTNVPAPRDRMPRWTVVSKDRRRTAQFEQTVLVTGDGHEILTLP